MALLWLTGLSGALVFIEPSPYELISVVTMAVFAITGLRLSAALLPLVALLFLINLGYLTSVIPVLDQPKTATWVAVSLYLSVTAVFFAAMLGTNTEARLKALMAGYMGAAIVASLVAIAGYFRLFGGASEFLLLYGRARGTFNDPNVLGAFLILPALLALRSVLKGKDVALLYGAGCFGLFTIAALLSFSRGAWGQLAFATAAFMALSFVTSRTPAERLRIISVAMWGALALAILLIVLLSIGKVAELFEVRASLDQSYDVGHLGRFGRHLLGFLLALDRPLGIGPLQFPHYFPEDPHNSYLNAFMSGGWLTGFSYIALIGTLLVIATRRLTVRTPWHTTYFAVYAATLGTAAESIIIDSDHWRHYFLMIGVLWGLAAVSRVTNQT